MRTWLGVMQLIASARVTYSCQESACQAVVLHCSQTSTRIDMALNSRSAEAERLAAELARLAGETKTEAVTEALRGRLARLAAQALSPATGR